MFSLFGKQSLNRVHSVVKPHTAPPAKTKCCSTMLIASVKGKNQELYSPAGYSTCVKDIDCHRGGAEHCSSAAILPGHRASRFDESAWNACAASANQRLPRAAKIIGHSPWRFSEGEKKICSGTNDQSDTRG